MKRVGKNSTPVALVALLLACGFWLFMGVAAAHEIDLDKPIELEPGNGVAVFSFTASGDIQNSSFLSWRKVGADDPNGEIRVSQAKFFGNEEFFDSPRKKFGRLAALTLPAGTYEFYSYRNEGYKDMRKAKQEFSRRFTVEPGKIQYVGSLDVYALYPEFSGGRLLAAALIGVWFGSIEVLPTLSDAADIDLPLIISKGNGLALSSISRNVAPDENDRRILDYLQTLRIKADKGDVSAQSQLMHGLSIGWTLTENMERIRVMTDHAMFRQLAEVLSARGVSGADYYLGKLYDPLINNQLVEHPPADGKRAFNYYLADAGRYFRPAMSRVSRVYDKGFLDVKEDSIQTSLWDKRIEAMVNMDVEALPYVGESGKAEFQRFADASTPRYFALSPSGAYGLSIDDDASAKAAIASCEGRNAGATDRCRLYAANRLMAWEACPAQYAGPQAMTFPPMTGLGDVADTARLPATLKDAGKKAYRSFLAFTFPRAFAVSDKGEVGMASGDCHAAFKALKACAEKTGQGCKLYAQDDQIVLDAADPKLAEEQRRMAALVEAELLKGAQLTSQPVQTVN
ncbi:MAG: hypothetical protein PHG47_10325 [Sulfuricella sp.]|nr:hypothetical protein [Sulfuricella sp.]